MTIAAPCIVLAGGLGTRLRSEVADLPKCLAPVGSRSFLEIQLEALAAQGIDHFVLSLGYMADRVQQAASRFTLGSTRLSVVVERLALGTGGAVLNAMHETGIDEALIANGDTFLDAPLTAMTAPLSTAGGERARMAVIEVPDRARFGGVSVEGGLVTGFVEKGVAGPGPINAGLYRLHRSAFGDTAPGSAFSLESVVFPRLVVSRSLFAAELRGGFIDIGVPDDYRAFRRRFAGPDGGA